VQRREKAQEKAKEIAHKEKLEERKRLREERKEAIDRDLKRFKEAMNDINGQQSNSDEEEEIVETDAESDYSDWDGLENGRRKNGILKKHVYNDDDGDVTTVVIEDFEEEDTIDTGVDISRSEQVLKESIERARKYAKFVGQEEAKVKKAKQKKFRYLSKTERKSNAKKERARNKDKRERGRKR
jgi:ribosomal RNA-processing protein 17